MNISIKQTNVSLSQEDKELFIEKLESLEKFHPKILQIRAEIEKDTHHRKGDVYRAELQINIPQKSLYVEKVAPDARKAMEKVKDHAKKILSEEKKKMIDKSRRS